MRGCFAMSEPSTLAKIRMVAALAVPSAELLVCQWLPEGRRQGNEWVARNPAREDHHAGSFGVSLASGKWNDFADGNAKGSDLVSLYAYLYGCRQVEAAMAIDRTLGLGVFRHNGRHRIRRALVTVRNDGVNRQPSSIKSDMREQAACRARLIWRCGVPAREDHPYLIAKQLPPFDLRQNTLDNALMIPLYHQGRLVNLQCIDEKGRKRFLKGGRVLGAYAQFTQNTKGDAVLVCEGWATGATLYQATGRRVICAMSVGNLRLLVQQLRDSLGPRARLVVMGDDDRCVEGNPGRKQAIAAAQQVGAEVYLPRWPADAPLHLTDFNDLFCWTGLKEKPYVPPYWERVV